MRTLLLLLGLVGSGHQQDGIEIKKRSDYITVKRDPNAGNHEIYTSMQEMEEFFLEELEYVEDIRAIYDKKLISPEGKDKIAAYIQSFEDLIGEQEEDVSIVRNPLNAYNLLRHVAIGWAVVEEAVEEEKNKRGGTLGKRLQKVLSRRDKSHVPDETDVDGVARGIVRLHDYYRFNLTEFVNEGSFVLDGVRHETSGDLTVWDAFKIGVKGTNGLILGSGINILEEALAKANVDGVTTPVFVEKLDIQVLKNLIKTAKTVHDQKLDVWGDRTDVHSTNSHPYSKKLRKKKKFQKKIDQREKNIELGNPFISTDQEMYQYMMMCRGVELRSVNVTSKLYCKYSTGYNPTYKIGPLKVEIVSLSPYIVIIHDFIHDAEIKDVIKTATPLLRRSEMVGTGINGTVNDNRVSETAWLNETISLSLGIMTDRISGFLNLNGTSAVSSELYQVVNYGLAGQYIHHFDAVLMDKSSIQNRDVFNLAVGDRMVTIMGYLSDVESGGYTVFPAVGAIVKPRRGSVVLWWNMDKSGGYDQLVKHGGCPVMIGSKWITNKWIRSNEQMFRKPCPVYTRKQVRDFRNNPKQKLQKGEFFSEP